MLFKLHWFFLKPKRYLFSNIYLHNAVGIIPIRYEVIKLRINFM